MINEPTETWEGLPSSLRRVSSQIDYSKEIDTTSLISRVEKELSENNQARPTATYITMELRNKN